MIRISAKLTPEAITQAIQKLSPRQRLKVLRNFRDELLSSHLRETVKRIRAKGPTPSFKKITDICEKVRQDIYDKKVKGSR